MNKKQFNNQEGCLEIWCNKVEELHAGFEAHEAGCVGWEGPQHDGGAASVECGQTLLAHQFAEHITQTPRVHALRS